MLTGIRLMGFFTVLWSAWAFASENLVLVGFGVIGVGCGALLLFKRLRSVPNSAPSHDEATTSRPLRPLLLALILEFVAIAATSYVLGTVNPALIQPAIALIVGLHFLVFYFSPETRSNMHLVTTVAGVVIGATGLVAIANGQTATLVHALVGLGMSCITLSYGAVFVRAVARQ